MIDRFRSDLRIARAERRAWIPRSRCGRSSDQPDLLLTDLNGDPAFKVSVAAIADDGACVDVRVAYERFNNDVASCRRHGSVPRA